MSAISGGTLGGFVTTRTRSPRRRRAAHNMQAAAVNVTRLQIRPSGESLANRVERIL